VMTVQNGRRRTLQQRIETTHARARTNNGLLAGLGRHSPQKRHPVAHGQGTPSEYHHHPHPTADAKTGRHHHNGMNDHHKGEEERAQTAWSKGEGSQGCIPVCFSPGEKPITAYRGQERQPISAAGAHPRSKCLFTG